MTIYLMLFRQGQAAVSASLSAIGGMYEDNLYLSTLYEYLETSIPATQGTAVKGPDPSDGIRFEHVGFTYPGSDTPALQDIDLHIRPGQSLALVGQNGSGKTTLIKLRSEEHTSELQSLMRISYAVFCLKKKKEYKTTNKRHTDTTRQ